MPWTPGTAPLPYGSVYPTPPGSTPGSSYNVNPASQPGSGTFGSVPGPIGLPNPAADLSQQFPALTQANSLAGTDLLSQLGGVISPGTTNALKLASAQFGVGSGMPLSGLSTNQLFGNIAGFSEGLQQQGLQNYPGLTAAISGTQTVNPALQTEIANRNATMAAAPNPTDAANYAQSLFDEYLNRLAGPGGGTGGAGSAGSPSGGTDATYQNRLDAYNSFWNPTNPAGGAAAAAPGVGGVSTAPPGTSILPGGDYGFNPFGDMGSFWPTAFSTPSSSTVSPDLSMNDFASQFGDTGLG